MVNFLNVVSVLSETPPPPKRSIRLRLDLKAPWSQLVFYLMSRLPE